MPPVLLKKINSFKMAIVSFQAKLKDRVQKFKELRDAKKNQAQSAIPLKEQAMLRVARFKALLMKTPLRSRAEDITTKLSPFLVKIFAIPRTQILVAASVMLMIFAGSYSVYVSSQNIYIQEWGSRAPASADKYLDRPDYLKFQKRTLKVFNVRIPIYVDSVKAVRSVTVDFTVRTDTRFARQFLEEYEYKLKDYFFMTTEPMISTFPLEDEGKDVLKDKIQDELNIFLENEKVEGKVLEVDIIFIIGS